MSSDIQPGDVVVCVDARPNPEWLDCPGYVESLAHLREGRIYRVIGVDGYDADAYGCVGLFLMGLPDIADEHGRVLGWSSSRFRKLRHADPEFIALLKRERVLA